MFLNNIFKKSNSEEKIDKINETELEEFLPFYNDILNEYLELNSKYETKVYSINNYEKVVVFEDSVIVYVGVKPKRRILGYGQERTYKDNFIIVFQELLSDRYFSFNKSNFLFGKRDVKVVYKIFDGNPYASVIKRYREVPKVYDSNFDYVNEKLPQLKLKDRYDNWKGWLYYFIVYELEYNGKKGYYMIHTQNNNPYKYAFNKEKYMEEEQRMFAFGWADEKMDDTKNENVVGLKDAYNYYFLYNFSQYLVDKKTGKARQDAKRVGDYYYFLDGVVKYFVIPEYLKDKNDLFALQKKVFDKVTKEQYPEYERQTFHAKEYSWKSELLMFECIKKVFKNNTVIHQYNPYFLRQMSYDVYVCGKKIAFEYQGKQHFEPVEFFGGEESHKKQVERDQKKKKLSEENGVKLIYVNYWEDITVDLIKKKLEEYEKQESQT